MLLTKFLLFTSLIFLCFGQVTKIVKRNSLLYRKKRYLAFPTSSNFVITMSFIKAFLILQPKGWNFLGECDVPFALPNDTRPFKHRRKNYLIQKREIFTQLEESFFQSGFNGTACLKRMICEAQEYIDMRKGKSLVRDILSAVFSSSEYDLDARYQNFCDNSSFSECTMPFMAYILGAICVEDIIDSCAPLNNGHFAYRL